MRETSLKAYREAVESGLLSKQRDKVFFWMCQFTPCTVNELIQHVGELHKPLFRTPDKINRYPSILKRMNLVKDEGKRNCKVTGKECVVWDLTHKKIQKEVKLKKIETMSSLRRRIKQLEKELHEERIHKICGESQKS